MRYPLGDMHVKDMELKNGFLFMCMRGNSSIRVYSATDYSFISSFNKREEGYDFKMSQMMKSASPYLYMMEVNRKNEIRKFEIDSLGQSVLLQRGYTGVSNSMNQPYIVNDSLILFDEFIPEASIKIHNLHTNSTELTLPYGTTSLDNRFWDKNMGGLYANDSCIIFVYKYQDRIDFYDWQFNLTHSVNHQKSEPAIYQHESPRDKSPDNVLYYGFSFMGRNYFYTLYRGVSNRVFRSDSLLVNKDFGVYCYGITRNVLEVYGLDGHPVGRFRFDDVSPGVFVVDEEQNRLLGYRDAYPSSLLVYELEGLPKNGKKYPEPEKNHHHSSLPDTPEPEKAKAFIPGAYISTQSDIAPSYYLYMEGIGFFPTVELMSPNRP